MNMATRKPSRPLGTGDAAPQADPSDIEFPPDDGPEEITASPLAAIMSLLGGGGGVNVVVYRQVRGEKPRYLFEAPGESFTIDRLRDEYNGGDFRLFISVNGTLRRNVVVSVEAPAEKKRDPGIGGNADLAIALREGFAAQTQLLRDTLVSMRTSAPPPPSVDMPALMESMARMMAILRGPDPAPPAVTPATGANPTALIDILLKGVELGKSFVPGAEPEGLSGLMGKLLQSPLVSAAASAVMSQTAQPPPAPVPTPATPRVQAVRQPAQPAPSPTPQPQGTDAMMTRYIAQLVKWAEAEADPDVYAIMIVDNVPEVMLRKILAAPDALDQMAAVNPGVNIYRPWFEALREGVITHLDGSPDEDESVNTNSGLTGSGVGANVAQDVYRPDPSDISGNAA